MLIKVLLSIFIVMIAVGGSRGGCKGDPDTPPPLGNKVISSWAIGNKF